MSIDVIFMHQNFSFNDDLLVYLKALKLSESTDEALMNVFLSKKKCDEYGFILLNKLEPDLKRHADKFIKELCNQGVYSESVDDFTFNNDGYKAIKDVVDAGNKKVMNILSDEADAFYEGMIDAQSSAAANVTGSGVSIWTNSIAALAVSSALEQRTINKQIQKANAEYKDALDELAYNTRSESDMRTYEYLEDIYIPSMVKAFGLFSYSLLQLFITALINNNKFDPQTLNNANINQSNTFLNNMRHITDHGEKLKCIKEAFKACPFNESVYISAVENDAFEENVFVTAKGFHLEKAVISYLKNKLEISESVDLEEQINKKNRYIKAYSVCIGKDYDSTLHELTNHLYKSIISNYKSVKYKVQKSVLEENVVLTTNENDIEEKVRNEISNITSEKSLTFLMHQCGHSRFFTELSKFHSDDAHFETKQEADDALLKKFTDELIAELKNRQAEIIEIQKAEEERKKKEDEERKKEAQKTRRNAIVCIAFFGSAIALPLLILNLIIPQTKYNNAISLMNSGMYDEAKAAFEEIIGVNDSKDKIEECKIAVLDCKYTSALEKMNTGNYDDAINDFKELGEYKDSKDKIIEAYYEMAKDQIENKQYSIAITLLTSINEYKDSKKLIDECNYQMAIMYMEVGELDKAISLFEFNIEYRNSQTMINECKYIEAKSLLNKGQKYEAYSAFKAIEDYKDSALIANDLYENHYGEYWPGETLAFGNYNGTPITWVVIQRTNDRIWILSEKCLDYKPIVEWFSSTIYYDTYIKSWLNNEFISNLSENEQGMILDVTSYGKVFLLSVPESLDYLTKLQRQVTDTNNKECNWWLRTQGKKHCESYVDKNGIVYENGEDARNKLGVRPAMWIKNP